MDKWTKKRNNYSLLNNTIHCISYQMSASNSKLHIISLPFKTSNIPPSPVTRFSRLVPKSSLTKQVINMIGEKENRQVKGQTKRSSLVLLLYPIQNPTISSYRTIGEIKMYNKLNGKQGKTCA